jgi:UDP-N-acetylglucosamine--dolichyl-phosphate N-acetylglucosaminephosphotransferase
MIPAILVYITLSFILTFASIPVLINKLRKANIVETDVNKREKPKIPFLGGLTIIFGFSITVFLVSGMSGYLNLNLDPSVAFLIISVPILSGFIGLTDDLILIPRTIKAMVMMIPAVPLIILHLGVPEILLPFEVTLDLTNLSGLYWFVLVPLGITGAANAIGFTDGYNGLAAGETLLASFYLLIISFVVSANEIAILIFGALIGSCTAFLIFNKYPSRIFLGDTGSLTLGALIGMGVIVGGIEFYGVVCILPTFYELGATSYYKFKGIERRHICINPVILEDGILKPPEGSERFTLPYLLLSKKPLHEKKLVGVLLSLYAICGALALGLSLL